MFAELTHQHKNELKHRKRKKEQVHRKRVKELTNSHKTETTSGFKVYATPKKLEVIKKFTLVAPLKARGRRSIFIVRNDNTGKHIFQSYKRKDAEDKQRELMAA